MVIRFWENAHLPLPYANINTSPLGQNIAHLAWLRGGVGGQFPRNV